MADLASAAFLPGRRYAADASVAVNALVTSHSAVRPGVWQIHYTLHSAQTRSLLARFFSTAFRHVERTHPAAMFQE